VSTTTVPVAGICDGRCNSFAANFARFRTAFLWADLFPPKAFLTNFFAGAARLARRFEFFALARRDGLALFRAATICP